MLIHHFGSIIFALLPAMLLCACFNADTDGMRSLATSLVRGLSQRPVWVLWVYPPQMQHSPLARAEVLLLCWYCTANR
jgi:hypothetical protein